MKVLFINYTGIEPGFFGGKVKGHHFQTFTSNDNIKELLLKSWEKLKTDGKFKHVIFNNIQILEN